MSRFIGGFAGQKAAYSFIAARKKALAAEARAVCNPARAAAKAYREKAKAADLKQFNDYYAYGETYDTALHAALATLGVPEDVIRETSSGKTRSSMGMLNLDRKRAYRPRGRRIPTERKLPNPARDPTALAEQARALAAEMRAPFELAGPTPIVLNEDLDKLLDFSIPAKDLPLVLAIIDAHPEVISSRRADNIAESGQIDIETLQALEAVLDPAISDKLADIVLPPKRAVKLKTPPKRAVESAPARDVSPALGVQMAERTLVLTGAQERMLPKTADRLALIRHKNPELLVGTPFEARQGDWPYYQFRTSIKSDIAARDMARGRIQRGLKGRHLEHTPLEFWIDEWANIKNQAEAVDDVLAWGLDYILDPKLAASRAGRNIPSLAAVFPAERKRMLEDLSFAWNGLVMLFHTRLGIKQTDRATARYLKTAVPGADIVEIQPADLPALVEAIEENPHIVSNTDLKALLDFGEIPVAAVVALAAAAHDPRYDMDKNNLLQSDIEYIASTLTEQLFGTNKGLSKKNTADFEKVLNTVADTLSIALSSGEEVSDASLTAMAQGQATYDAIKKPTPSKRAVKEERKDPAPDITQTARTLADTVLGIVGDKTGLSKDQKAAYTKTFNGIRDTLEETTSPELPNGNLDLAMSRAMDMEERKNTPKNAVRTFVFDSSGKPLNTAQARPHKGPTQLSDEQEATMKLELGATIMGYLKQKKDGDLYQKEKKRFVDIYNAATPSVRSALLKGMNMANAIRNAGIEGLLHIYR
jgi:hypothetical protein